MKLRAADPNAIPQDLRGFDFCFSVGRIHMLGTIARGIQFMENMVDVLKPGGIAVHTTEFSFAVDDQTIDNWGTVLFQRRHFEEMAQRMERKGCKRDAARFRCRLAARWTASSTSRRSRCTGANLKDWSRDAMHIKVSIDGFPCTAFGLIAAKNP